MRPLNLQTAPAMTTARAAGPLRLDHHDVDVWSASLDEPGDAVVREMQALLSIDEARRARTFYFERDRRRYVVGRGILRRLLGRYLGCDGRAVEFEYGPQGKPALKRSTDMNAGERLHFNVAHSEGLALYAFTRAGAVGIDVEFIRDLPDWRQVAEAAFSPQERAQLRACPPDRQREEFFRAWTRQEAVLKALGTGLPGASALAAGTEFKVYPLQPAAGFAAALATVPAGRWMMLQTWEPARDRQAKEANGSRQRTHLGINASSSATFL